MNQFMQKLLLIMTYTLINALEEMCSQELDSEIWGTIRVKHVGRNSKLGATQGLH